MVGESTLIKASPYKAITAGASEANKLSAFFQSNDRLDRRFGGVVTQLVECLLCKQDAWGSNPHFSTRFMIEFFFLLACPNPRLINRTEFPWNDHDQEVQATCIRRCPEIYSDAPCLKQFIKYGKQDYDCICGAKA